MDTDIGREWAEGFAIGINIDGGLWDACIADEDIFPCFAPIILPEPGHNPDVPDMAIYVRGRLWLRPVSGQRVG